MSFFSRRLQRSIVPQMPEPLAAKSAKGEVQRWADQHRMEPLRPLNDDITDFLPVEIYESFLQFLQDDTKELRNCASVCRVWRRISQDLIFRNLMRPHAVSVGIEAKVNCIAIHGESASFVRVVPTDHGLQRNRTWCFAGPTTACTGATNRGRISPRRRSLTSRTSSRLD